MVILVHNGIQLLVRMINFDVIINMPLKLNKKLKNSKLNTSKLKVFNIQQF